MADSVQFYWHIDARGHIFAIPANAPENRFWFEGRNEQVQVYFFQFQH